MNKKVLTSALALALLLLNLVSTSGANPSRTAPPADVVSYLPVSDAVAVIDVRRLVTEALPRIFARDPAKLTQVNSEIEQFKSRTGIDPRTFDRVALGVRYTYPSATVTKLETVAIAHGTFDARAVIAAGRSAASGKYREVSHHGATIAVFNIGDQIKFLGLWNMKVNELAACALDGNTLAIGSLPNVRAAIEAGKRGRASSELVALATRDPNALIGFGANITRGLLQNFNVGNDTVAKDERLRRLQVYENDTVAKDVGSIKQIYGSIGMTETDFTVLLVARAATAADARNLSDTVTGLKQLGGILIARMAPAKKNLAQSAIDNLKITTRLNELEIKTNFAAADLSAFLK